MAFSTNDGADKTKSTTATIWRWNFFVKRDALPVADKIDALAALFKPLPGSPDRCLRSGGCVLVNVNFARCRRLKYFPERHALDVGSIV